MNARGIVIWFTGVPASGKSTIAAAVQKELSARGLAVENLDSDQVRANLSPNLGYTAEARDENTRRLAWMSQMLSKHGINVIVAAVSPLRSHRDRARQWCEQFSATPRGCMPVPLAARLMTLLVCICPMRHPTARKCTVRRIVPLWTSVPRQC